MQALIGKGGAKSPTPQELYRARKQREEEEKTALLPPGYVNHGNTCFMNSVLQGLMATPMLADIVRFDLPDTFWPISARRSPQLTNGHGLGGPDEREWEQGMPLGDTFIILMYKAWKAQDERQKLTMSPKELLAKLGTKYDQYLDFRQQDAHELLRHLLDAMRMEEQDIIKRRQPPVPRTKRKRKTKGASSSSPRSDASAPQPELISEEDRLMPFVDMLFGGQLASILVCEKCKKVSFNFEDFDDLSLPIKQEEDEKARKRDRIRSLARKFGIRGRVAARDLDVPEGPRSSSVPSSPLRRSEEAEKSFEIVLNGTDARRRSLEPADNLPAIPKTRIEEVVIDEEPTQSHQRKEENRNLLSVSESQRGFERGVSPKEKDEDGWVKLRRRMSVGVKKSSKRRSKEPAPRKENHQSTIEESDAAQEADESFVEIKAPTPIHSLASSPKVGAGLALTRFPFTRKGSARGESASPALSTQTQTPDDSSTVPPSSRPSSPSPSFRNSVTGRKAQDIKPLRSKSSRSDSRYLKRLLADVPAPSATPFNIFRSTSLANSSPDISEMRGSWPKAGHVQSIEGCLRMFTSVEMLEGENMVRCRRCWKIQHGEYGLNGAPVQSRDDSEEDDNDAQSSASSASVKINFVDEEQQQSRDGISAGNSPQLSVSDIGDHPTLQSISMQTLSNSEILGGEGAPDPISTQKSKSVLPSVPSIAMTAPKPIPSPELPPTVVDEASATDSNNIRKRTILTSASRDSLQLPSPAQHRRMPAERDSLSFSLSSDASELTTDDSADEGPEGTETSLTASVVSESSVASNAGANRQPPPSDISRARETRARRSERARQVVLRRAYKRYLISKPPPVLVIHLKRFQQIGRSPLQYYSIANLKKIDDPVSFSEYLDISPFLLPQRDAMSPGKKENDEGGDRRCIYRLYAVVVHIGNMLGGHYVAYVALPDQNDVPSKILSHPSSAEDASLSPDQKDATSQQQRPQVPRTTSFARTASPPPPAHHNSRTRASQSISPGVQRRWCYVSDTTVRLVSLEEVLQSKAYICMYERLYL